MDVYVHEIQRGQLEHFPLLLEQFKPLILSWLKRIHQLHTSETEDYMSMAKIILLECAKSYDSTKNVPFQSYYKIKLYHWYGNQLQKRRIEYISLENERLDTYDFLDENFTKTLELEEQMELIYSCIDTLQDQEKEIFLLLLAGLSPREIGEQYRLSKKTIQNKKYIIIKKLQEAIKETPAAP